MRGMSRRRAHNVFCFSSRTTTLSCITLPRHLNLWLPPAGRRPARLRELQTPNKSPPDCPRSTGLQTMRYSSGACCRRSRRMRIGRFYLGRRRMRYVTRHDFPVRFSSTPVPRCHGCCRTPLLRTRPLFTSGLRRWSSPRSMHSIPQLLVIGLRAKLRSEYRQCPSKPSSS